MIWSAFSQRDPIRRSPVLPEANAPYPHHRDAPSAPIADRRAFGFLHGEPVEYAHLQAYQEELAARDGAPFLRARFSRLRAALGQHVDRGLGEHALRRAPCVARSRPLEILLDLGQKLLIVPGPSATAIRDSTLRRRRREPTREVAQPNEPRGPAAIGPEELAELRLRHAGRVHGPSKIRSKISCSQMLVVCTARSKASNSVPLISLSPLPGQPSLARY